MCNWSSKSSALWWLENGSSVWTRLNMSKTHLWTCEIGFLNHIQQSQKYLVIEIVWERLDRLAACVAQRAVHTKWINNDKTLNKINYVNQKSICIINVCAGNYWTAWKCDHVWTDPAWWYWHAPAGQHKKALFGVIPRWPDSRGRKQSDRMQQQQLTSHV